MRSPLVLLLVGALAASARAHCPDFSPLKNAYFGDLHTHTAYSLDAFNYGTRTDPAQAYAFATGASVDVALGYDGTAGEVPGPFGVTIDFSGRHLDFGAVTDHAEWLATDYGCTVDTSSPFYGSAYCSALRAAGSAPADQQPCAGLADQAGTGCLGEQTTAWGAEQQATEAANDPCKFTSFEGYEWTYAQAGYRPVIPGVLHKNILFRNSNVPHVPLDAINYPTSPILWAALAVQCNERTGCAALTIPHNMNQSAGLAFDLNGYTATDLNHMMKFQRLVEIHQHKGNSECLTDTADGGAAVTCDFEVNPGLADPRDNPGYARPGLEQGIVRFASGGYDPVKSGFVGGTDTHDALMGNVGKSAWPGALGAFDNTPGRRLALASLVLNPGGVTGIWAEENTRDALWAALERRETFATSGPALKVRFYEFTSPSDPCADSRFPAGVVAAGGVPMGGTMPNPGGAPRFVVYALEDQTPLASVDIVKGSVAGDVAVETVHTIPLGGAPYCVTWTDPTFDPSEPAFYYARVTEQPTWRWSHYDCQRLQASFPSSWQTIAPGCASHDPSTGGLDVMVQERAWTSSIWYLPGGPVTVQSTSLKLRDGSASANPALRTFSFKSGTRRDGSDHRIVIPAAGSAGDPTATGATGGGGTLTVYNPDSGETFTAALPAAGWTIDSSGTRYTFSDPLGAIQMVAVSADTLEARGGGEAFGYTLDRSGQGTIAVRVQLGTAAPWCAETAARATGLPPTTARNDTVDRFTGQPNAPPPDQCPLLG